MTLNANGPVHSSAMEFRENSFKPESPPPDDANNSRFKESLDKAIAEESGTVESYRATPAEGAKAEVQTKASESLKKPVSDEKKKVNIAGKIKVKADSGVQIPSELKPRGDKKELSLERPLLKTKKTSGKVDDEAPVKTGSLKTEENHVTEDLELESEEPDIHPDVKDKPLEQKETPAGEAVIIPFPQNGEIEVQASSVISDKGKPAASGVLKAAEKNQKKAKEEPTLTVIDNRSSEKRETVKTAYVSKTSPVTENVEQTGKENNQIILGEQNANRTGMDEVKSFESRFTDSREVLLTRELKDSGNEQIVKKASFILKDNNQGEIKLILKPESLGRVKIQLNMNENNLVGKIIVENSRVGQIFENNLSDLTRSFEEAGISSSSIEVSVGDGNKQSADQNKTFQNDQPYYSGRLKTLDEAVPALGRYGSENNQQLVNLVV